MDLRVLWAETDLATRKEVFAKCSVSEFGVVHLLVISLGGSGGIRM